MFGTSSRERMLERYRDAVGALEAGRFEHARALAEALVEARIAGGYEVLAQALRGLGDAPAARAVLERATREGPPSWVLWKQYADASAEAGDLDAAERAYEAALACAGVDRPLVELHRALALARGGRYDAALEVLERLRAARFDPPRVRAATLEALARAERWAALRERADALRSGRGDGDELDADERCLVEGYAARARLGEGDADGARALAAQALDRGGFEPRAAEVLRALEPPARGPLRRWRVLLDTTLSPEANALEAPRPEGYLRCFVVVAPTLDDATALASAMRAAGERGPCERLEATDLGPATGAPRGVYEAGPRLWYGRR